MVGRWNFLLKWSLFRWHVNFHGGFLRNMATVCWILRSYLKQFGGNVLDLPSTEAKVLPSILKNAWVIRDTQMALVLTRKTTEGCWCQTSFVCHPTSINWSQLESSLVQYTIWRCMKFGVWRSPAFARSFLQLPSSFPNHSRCYIDFLCSAAFFSMFMSGNNVTQQPAFFKPKWQRRSKQRTWRSRQTNALVDSQESLPPAWCAWHPRSNKSRRPSPEKERIFSPPNPKTLTKCSTRKGVLSSNFVHFFRARMAEVHPVLHGWKYLVGLESYQDFVCFFSQEKTTGVIIWHQQKGKSFKITIHLH